MAASTSGEIIVVWTFWVEWFSARMSLWFLPLTEWIMLDLRLVKAALPRLIKNARALSTPPVWSITILDLFFLALHRLERLLPPSFLISKSVELVFFAALFVVYCFLNLNGLDRITGWSFLRPQLRRHTPIGSECLVLMCRASKLGRVVLHQRLSFRLFLTAPWILLFSVPCPIGLSQKIAYFMTWLILFLSLYAALHRREGGALDFWHAKALFWLIFTSSCLSCLLWDYLLISRLTGAYRLFHCCLIRCDVLEPRPLFLVGRGLLLVHH